MRVELWSDHKGGAMSTPFVISTLVLVADQCDYIVAI